MMFGCVCLFVVCMYVDVSNFFVVVTRALQEVVFFLFVFTLLFLTLCCIAFHLGGFFSLIFIFLFKFGIYLIFSFCLSAFSFGVVMMELLFFSQLMNFFLHKHLKRLIFTTLSQIKQKKKKTIKLINLHKYYSFDIIISLRYWYWCIHVNMHVIYIAKKNIHKTIKLVNRI